MNIKVDLKKLFAAAVSAIMCLSAGGCYLLPDEEEVLDAPTVKASDVTYSTVTAKKKDLEKKIVATGTVTAENRILCSYRFFMSIFILKVYRNFCRFSRLSFLTPIISVKYLLYFPHIFHTGLHSDIIYF